MTPERRAFVDGFLALVQSPSKPESTAPPAEVRVFVNELLALVASSPEPAEPAVQREFLREFMLLAMAVLPTEDANVAFERLVVNRWQDLTWRVHGAVATRFFDLDPSEHLIIRALEDTPSLLGPLGWQRDEVSHTTLLGWALTRSGDLGRAIRAAFAEAVGARVPSDGWIVATERVLGPRCRIDVDVVIPGRWRCMIEAKVDAEEREKQLDDYRAHLDSWCGLTGGDGELVFLTIDGRDGDSDAPHRALGFDALLRAWLPLSLSPTPDALYLRLWLASVAGDLCKISETGPVSTWRFSRRVALLDFLARAGDNS